jgi:hypothetical protein
MTDRKPQSSPSDRARLNVEMWLPPTPNPVKGKMIGPIGATGAKSGASS